MSKVRISESKLKQLIKEEYEKLEKDVDLEEEELEEGIFDFMKGGKKDSVEMNTFKETLYSLFVDNNIDSNESREFMKFVSNTKTMKKENSGILGKVSAFLEKEANRFDQMGEKQSAERLDNIVRYLNRLVIAGQQTYNQMSQEELSGFKKSPEATPQDIARAKRAGSRTRTASSMPGRNVGGMVRGQVAEHIDKLIDEEIQKLLKENK